MVTIFLCLKWLEILEIMAPIMHEIIIGIIGNIKNITKLVR